MRIPLPVTGRISGTLVKHIDTHKNQNDTHTLHYATITPKYIVQSCIIDTNI